MYITSTQLNKIIDSIQDLYDQYIKDQYIKIIKYKAITLIVPKLEEIYTNFWGLYNSPFILKKSCICLLIDHYTQKLWVLLLKSKNKFFNTFK